jgi:hypothetical protein
MTIRQIADRIRIAFRLGAQEAPAATCARSLVDENNDQAFTACRNRTLRFRADLTQNETYDGLVMTGLVAGESITKFKVVTVNTSGAVVMANAADGERARGIALNAATSGQKVDILVVGVVRNNAWNFDPSSQLYLGANGAIDIVPNSNPDETNQVFGIALSADVGQFNFPGMFSTNS